ncbi:MAG: T9SS type A sorting domain-containing protein [Chitinophagaceae bacterium]
MKSIFTFRYLLITIVSVSAFLVSCKNKGNEKNSTDLVQREKDPNSRMTDIQGAMEYEFNMLKNPATGKIPDGIRDAELLQAKQILEEQQLNATASRITANPYTFQGPNNLGGRTRALAYDIRNGTSNSVIIAGGISGGIYKSTDDGATWVRKSPTGDLFNVSALAQDTRAGFRDTWYYAGGEFTGNSTSATGASYRGKGVYKSTDNGETWTLLPASNTGVYESFDHRADYVMRIVVDPTTGNVYVAAMDAIYRSTDGGTSWSIVLTSGSAGYGTGMATDIVVTSTGRFYAAFAGTSNTLPTDMPGVWSSTTGASGSWTKIAGSGSGTSPIGWQASGTYGRVVLALAPSLESRLYAAYWNGIAYSCGAPAPEADLFRWDDGISTWTDLSANVPDEAGCLTGNDPFAVQTGYDLVLAVKPDDPDVVFFGGTNIYRSTSGFTTTVATTRIGGYASPASYSLYASSHPDIHAIAFSPTSSTTMLCGNDGGIQRTTANLAGTVSWTQINTGYRTYQYYYVDIDPRVSNTKVLGGAQDNGSTRNIGGSGTDFEMVTGGDGVSVGLTDLIAGTQYEYVGSQLGTINRRTSGTALGFISAAITPAGESGTGLFVTLFKLDPDNTERLYYANDNALYRTTSASTVTSATWTSLTGVATSVGPANDITALAPSRGAYSAVTSSLFIGASNGKVYRLDDPTGVAAATAPVDITGAGFPAGAYVSSIAVNPRNDDTLLVTFSNYGVSSAWWTGDANSAVPTWTAVEGSLSLPSYRSAAIHAVPGSAEVQYFVGTSVGLYTVTGLPGVTTWTQEGSSSLGNAVVSSLSFRPSDANLLVGTHGYGMWKTVLSLFPLPVEMTEFKGTLQNNKSVLLQWTTSAEYGSKHFELEKSIDGINFRKIATIQAAGNSNSPRNYSYIDREPLTEKNYYRLKSVDIDNDSRLSNIVLVKVPNLTQDIQVLGNPFKDFIRVRFVKSPDTKGELRLTDMAGRVVARQSFVQGEQLVQFNIPAERTARGIYILQAFINGQIYTMRVQRE